MFGCIAETPPIVCKVMQDNRSAASYKYRLIAEAENRRKGYDRAIARTAKDAHRLKDLQVKSYAETVACNVYLRVQRAVIEMLDKDTDEVRGKLEALTKNLDDARGVEEVV